MVPLVLGFLANGLVFVSSVELLEDSLDELEIATSIGRFELMVLLLEGIRVTMFKSIGFDPLLLRIN